MMLARPVSGYGGTQSMLGGKQQERSGGLWCGQVLKMTLLLLSCVIRTAATRRTLVLTIVQIPVLCSNSTCFGVLALYAASGRTAIMPGH